MIPPFVAALGSAFRSLPEPIRALHGDPGARRWEGRVTVSGARGPTAWAMGLAGISPRPMEDAPFAIEIEPGARGEVWRRDFDGAAAVSRVSWTGGTLRERAGPVAFVLHPEPVPEGLRLRSGRFALMGLPLPLRHLPRGEVALGADGPRYLFDVAAITPTGGTALRYRGWLLPA